MTTPNVNRALSDIFDVELTTTDKPLEEIKIEAKKSETESLEKQREYVRGNLVELIEQGKTLFRNMSTIANSTESGKDFEVLTKMMKTLVDSNAKLLEAEITGKPPAPDNKSGTTPEQKAEQITNNTVFVGTTAELSQYMRRQQTTLDANDSQQ